MKHCNLFFTIVLFTLLSCFISEIKTSSVDFVVDNKSFTLQTTNTWHIFPASNNILNKKEKTALIGAITLKSKNATRLTKIILQWDGKPLPQVNASLYHKRRARDPLILIEKNLIGDGTWNITKQQLVFNLNEKIVSKHDYYLVVNFPSFLEPIVKSGHFSPARQDSLTIAAIQ